MNYIPVDDIMTYYSKAKRFQKEAISAVLRDGNFLVQTSQQTVMQELNIEEAGDLIITMLLQLEEEFGKAFTSSMASALLARFETDMIEKIARRAINNKEGGSDE